MSLIKSYSNRKVVKEYQLPSIFLAGPTNRDHITEWRIEACKILEDNGFGGVVYIPEYLNETFDNTRITEQCLWEREAFEYADCLLFWIPRSIKDDMPAFTTNVEFGTYLQRKPSQMVYGYPMEADKMRYLDWLYQYEKGPDANIYHSLTCAVEKAQEVAEWVKMQSNF